MGIRFPSVEWTTAFKDAINENAGYAKAGAGWTHGKVAYVVTARPDIGIEEDTAMVLDMHEGACRGAEYVSGEDADGAEFVIQAEYERWKAVMSGELNPTKAMMQNKLKLKKGHLPTIVKFVVANKELVKSALNIDTDYPRLMGIELAPSAADNGLAIMMATMMSQNLEDHPERKATFDRLFGRVAIVAEDADVALTMHFERGRAVVHDGIVGIPDVTLRGSAELISDMSRMENNRFGLPDPKGEVNKAMWAGLRDGRLRIFGLPAGLPLLSRLGTVLAIE